MLSELAEDTTGNPLALLEALGRADDRSRGRVRRAWSGTVAELPLPARTALFVLATVWRRPTIIGQLEAVLAELWAHPR